MVEKNAERQWNQEQDKSADRQGNDFSICMSKGWGDEHTDAYEMLLVDSLLEYRGLENNAGFYWQIKG